MIVVLTRVFAQPEGEWPFGRTYLVGYTDGGVQFVNEAVPANISIIGIVYVHREYLTDNTYQSFPRFWQEACADSRMEAVIAHPGEHNSIQDIKNKLVERGCALSEMIPFVAYHGVEAVDVVKLIDCESQYREHKDFLLTFVKAGGTNASNRAHRIIDLLGGISIQLQEAQGLLCKGKNDDAKAFLSEKLMDGKEAIKKINEALALYGNEQLREQGGAFVKVFGKLTDKNFDAAEFIYAVGGENDKFARWMRQLMGR